MKIEDKSATYVKFSKYDWKLFSTIFKVNLKRFTKGQPQKG